MKEKFKKFKLSKKLLFSTFGIAALSTTVPIALTSCSEELNNSKSIEFVDLSKFSTVEVVINGQNTQSYQFVSTTVNDNFKNKSEDEIKSMLGVLGESKSKISKDAFNLLINEQTFVGATESGTSSGYLIWSNIKTSALDNENVESRVSFQFSSESFKLVIVSFELLNDATWSNGSTALIQFVIRIL